MTATSKPWNKHQIIGQKRPLKISHIWGDSNPIGNGRQQTRFSIIQHGTR